MNADNQLILDLMEQMEQRINTRIDAVHEDVRSTDHAIRGNGKPGLRTRVDRLEQSEKNRSKVVWLTITSVGALIGERVKQWIGGV